jgi:hypothetical protein
VTWRHRALAILTLGPVICWLAAIGAVLALGAIFGCRIDEGSAHPCMVFGADLGKADYSLSILAAWGPRLFAPVVLCAGLLWAVVAIITRLRNR